MPNEHKMKNRKSKNSKPSQSPNKTVRSAQLVTSEKKSRLPSRGKQIGITLWKVLLSELNLEYIIEPAGRKNADTSKQKDSEAWNENLSLLLNYIYLPLKVENFMVFGLIYSTVMFLKWLIILPSRWVIHSFLFVLHSIKNRGLKTKNGHFSESLLIMYKNDTLSMLGILSTLILLKDLDTSKIYHNIRSGTAVKLYFMTQVLEIADRLLSASGQDILKVLYDFNCISIKNKYSLTKMLQFSVLCVVSVIYLWFHSYVLVYQVMALNVAINSYSNALLTLILSNQFSELKSAVFKKTEREGLFQMSCSDLNERFLILIMLGIISSRNLLQIILNTNSLNGFFNNIKPNSWSTQLTPWKSFDDWLGLLIGPSILVIGSEILVDWVKHAYIIRFNRIKPSIYEKYTRILANDFINGLTFSNLSKSTTYLNEHPNLLTKRTGFPIATVVVIFCKLSLFPYLKYQISSITATTEHGTMAGVAVVLVSSLLFIALLAFLRLLLSLILIQWSKRILRSQNNALDYIAGDPNVNLSKVDDVRVTLYDIDEKIPPSLEELRLQKLNQNKDNKLNGVVRFEMADKRIW